MRKKYIWTEEELVEANLQSRRLVGSPRQKGIWLYSTAIAVLGLVCSYAGLLRLYLLINGFVETLSSEGIKEALLVLFLWNGTETFLCLIQLSAAAFAVYFLFFRRKHQIKKRIQQNKKRLLAPQVLELDGDILRISAEDSGNAWALNRFMTVCFAGSYIYGLYQETEEKKTLSWMLPRRIFGDGEEAAFREGLARSCEIKDDLRKIDKMLSRGDLTALSAAISLHLLFFALELVALQDLPGRTSFNYWIYSVALCPLFLLVYLVEAIRSFRAESGKAAEKILNLILIVLSVLLFVPYGAGADYAYVWAGIMGVVLIFQIRRLWLVSRDCGRAEDGFHVSFLKAGGGFLILALLMDCLFLLLLLIFRLSIREIHAVLDQIREQEFGEPLMTSQLSSCAALWNSGTVFACAGALCLLIERGSFALKRQKGVLSFCLLILVLTALFFLRSCQNLVLCFAWIVLIVGLLFGIKQMLQRFVLH